MKLKVLELFSGFECISNAFREKGHECFTIDWDERFPSSMHCDISKLQVEDLPEEWRHPDVIFAGTDCFTKGTLVLTQDGYKEIQNITCNDYVLTHTGQYKQVYNTIQKQASNLYDIKISGCETITCTPNHPFYVRKKKPFNTHKNGKPFYGINLGEPQWINAENLDNSYKIGIPINQNSIIPQWNGVVYNNNSKTTKKGNIQNTLSSLLGSENFWWFVGRYIGDGYLSNEKSAVKNRYQIDLCCSLDEIQEVKHVINNLGLTYGERTQGSLHHFSFSSKELWGFLCQFGIGAENKQITNTILDLPINLLKSFLDGYISADGHWDYSLSNPCCSITTISRKLAYGFQHCILKAYGRYGSIVKRTNQTNVICGRVVNVKPTYTVCFYKNKTSRLQYTIENNTAWINIKKVKYTDKSDKVYTLSVIDDESFTANNVIVHNCTSYSVAAISKHRRKNPITGNLDPISDKAKFADKMNRHVRELMEQMHPKIIIFENPMGAFRKMDFVNDLILNTTTYCQYGFTYRKQTDFLSNIDLHLKPPCKNGSPCHEKAPRGARTGLQAIKDPALKAIYPPKLCEHIVEECEKYIYKGEN